MDREEVRFEADGERCAAWLYRPAAVDHPVPCVVMGSGLSCVRDQGMDSFGERFAAAGVAALAFDYRGFGDSEGEPRQLPSTYRQREDFRAALAFAGGLDGIDPDRLILWGYSLGGGHVQHLAGTEPGIAAAICIAPVVNRVRTLLHVGGPRHVGRISAAGARDALMPLLGRAPHRIPAAGPSGSGALLDSADAAPGFAALTAPGSTWLNEVCPRVLVAPPFVLGTGSRRISCPILYCLVEDDDINPPALGEKAARRAPQGELRLYPGGHFDPFLGETFERVAADQVDFVQRHFGASDR
jgi:dienelactone hydrolase